YDGAEIYESVITLLRLDQADAQVRCFAPNISQLHVINHLSGEVAEAESRNVLVEAARLVRGEIEDLAVANADDFDALIVPGGFGAAKNLCDFAVNGAKMTVNADFLAFAQAFHRQGKPVGLVCIAPAMSAAIFGAGVNCTIGDDADTAAAIEATGASHRQCPVEDICIDDSNNLITTPAYMLAGRISEAAAGINKLVDSVLARA
ncbi:MAG: isoprenoid biosynthesis glyoxalase ElbB, partial [Porticoccaceae bacterium]|nr:isoprenoid biosynthesis glyoxalase ElbB [Porticoccaceae bacterium]